jgi:hypothetical protein
MAYAFCTRCGWRPPAASGPWCESCIDWHLLENQCSVRGCDQFATAFSYTPHGPGEPQYCAHHCPADFCTARVNDERTG